MPRLVSPPEEKIVKCQECRAKIGYLPEEVEAGRRSIMGREWENWKRVKCPRADCLGHGYIEGAP